MALALHRVSAVPAVLQAGSIYLHTKTANTADLFVANSTGNRVDVVTDALINALVDAKLSAFQTLQVLDDIAARDALTPSEGDQAYVVDASADSTVTSGSAKYVYDGSAWQKVYEEESLDVNYEALAIAWTQLTGGPTSSPAQIDSAVTNSHIHTNATVLGGLTEIGGDLGYGGEPVQKWATEDW